GLGESGVLGVAEIQRQRDCRQDTDDQDDDEQLDQREAGLALRATEDSLHRSHSRPPLVRHDDAVQRTPRSHHTPQRSHTMRSAALRQQKKSGGERTSWPLPRPRRNQQEMPELVLAGGVAVVVSQRRTTPVVVANIASEMPVALPPMPDTEMVPVR